GRLGAAEALADRGEGLLEVTEGGDAVVAGLLAALAEGGDRVAQGLDRRVDRGRGRLQGLGALAAGLGVRVVTGPAATGALVTQELRLLVDRFGRRAAARAGQVAGVGRAGPRAGPDLFGLGDPGHHVIQLGVAAQHGLVVSGLVGLVQPGQDLGLQPSQPQRLGQRALHGPVPLGAGQVFRLGSRLGSGQPIVITRRHWLSVSPVPEEKLRPGFWSALGRGFACPGWGSRTTWRDGCPRCWPQSGWAGTRPSRTSLTTRRSTTTPLAARKARVGPICARDERLRAR